jgi:hypothetical protein
LFSGSFSSSVSVHNGDVLRVGQAVDRFVGAVDHGLDGHPLHEHDGNGQLETLGVLTGVLVTLRWLFFLRALNAKENSRAEHGSLIVCLAARSSSARIQASALLEYHALQRRVTGDTYNCEGFYLVS